MKKLIIALSTALILISGCGTGREIKSPLDIPNYIIMNIDSCEYIVIDRGQYGFALQHKGDCSNPKHKN